MAAAICFTTQDFHCPVTHRMEKVCVKHVSPTSGGCLAGRRAFPLQPEIETCSGLTRCDVRDPGRLSSSFHWDRCPLQASLKSGQ